MRDLSPVPALALRRGGYIRWQGHGSLFAFSSALFSGMNVDLADKLVTIKLCTREHRSVTFAGDYNTDHRKLKLKPSDDWARLG